MEPFQGAVNISEKSYTAMQGIIHFIGWSIAIAILYFMFKFVKKHNQQDERAKKYSSGDRTSPKEDNSD